MLSTLCRSIMTYWKDTKGKVARRTFGMGMWRGYPSVAVKQKWYPVESCAGRITFRMSWGASCGFWARTESYGNEIDMGDFLPQKQEHIQGHVERKQRMFYFVTLNISIFVLDTEKCLSTWLIHLRAINKYLIFMEKPLDNVSQKQVKIFLVQKFIQWK